ncbi:hypothetical protein SDC9_205477 [bioreactor metagenome]|uniref:Uncharacterized protein n=1 Tax=bioreactor metagenome TaxID=1076179 RepID=A0A645JDZ8_9ZZZZ
MIIGDDIAVAGDDKAGARRRALDNLSKNVGADNVHRDAHGGADVVGVNLRQG